MSNFRCHGCGEEGPFRLRAGNPAMDELEALDDGMPVEVASLASSMLVGVLAKCEACGDEMDVADLTVGAEVHLDIIGRALRADRLMADVATAAANVRAWLEADDEPDLGAETDPMLDLYLLVEDALTKR